MKKKAESNLRTSIKSMIEHHAFDDALIDDLIDWIKISNRAKEDLQQSIKDDGAMSWQALTTISMSTKAILSISKSLGISPFQRKNKEGDKKPVLNLNEFLSSN
jgi:hypothetical protein